VSADELCYELPGGGRALFTARAEGSFALGREASECERAEVRERVLSLTGAERLARGWQVHEASVRRIWSLPVEELPDEPADGQATLIEGTALMVVGADCLPVALGGEGAVAMLHAGWRGLAGGVLEEGVSAVRELCPGDGPLQAVIGPGAGPCCYEVGPEVHAAFGARVEGSCKIDLRALARARLRGAGVEHVRDVELCTICDERFFSHRREGERGGRQAGVAWLS
jgi:purine-nucleoside/S-methyl-5'-thioadenosine phosphorylase / adenosine deaminase